MTAYYAWRAPHEAAMRQRYTSWRHAASPNLYVSSPTHGVFHQHNIYMHDTHIWLYIRDVFVTGFLTSYTSSVWCTQVQKGTIDSRWCGNAGCDESNAGSLPRATAKEMVFVNFGPNQCWLDKKQTLLIIKYSSTPQWKKTYSWHL